MPTIKRPSEEEEAELRAVLRPRKRPPVPKQPNLWLGRHIVMTQRDVDAFVRVLRSRYPTMVFFERRYDPGVDERLRLVDRPSASDTIRGVVPQGEWNASTFCALDEEQQKSTGMPETQFEFCACAGPWALERASGEPLETLNCGDLRGTWMRNDIETRRFVRSILWLSTKITTNKLKVIDSETGAVIWPSISGSYCGFDALRWCLEKPYRVIDEECRPTDDWVMPDSPWYD